jgi:hypothetical protein
VKNEVKINAEDISSTSVINMIEVGKMPKDFLGATNLQKEYRCIFLSNMLLTILERYASSSRQGRRRLKRMPRNATNATRQSNTLGLSVLAVYGFALNVFC